MKEALCNLKRQKEIFLKFRDFRFPNQLEIWILIWSFQIKFLRNHFRHFSDRASEISIYSDFQKINLIFWNRMSTMSLLTLLLLYQQLTKEQSGTLFQLKNQNMTSGFAAEFEYLFKLLDPNFTKLRIEISYFLKKQIQQTFVSQNICLSFNF